MKNERLYAFDDEELRKIHSVLDEKLETIMVNKDEPDWAEWGILVAEFKGEIVRREVMVKSDSEREIREQE